jgi:hypothetical protein
MLFVALIDLVCIARAFYNEQQMQIPPPKKSIIFTRPWGQSWGEF